MTEKHKIKLIGLDLDGTLLNGQKQITPRTLDAIQKAISQGVMVLPATGRAKSGIPEEVLAIPGIRYALTGNGASVWDLLADTLLYSCPLSVSTVLELLEFLQPFPAITQIYLDNLCYIDEAEYEPCLKLFEKSPFFDYIRRTHVAVRDLPAFLLRQNRPVDKINQITTDPALKKRIADALAVFPHIAVSSSVSTHLEINHIDANKGNGLLKLGELLGIGRLEIMACGDGDNDCEMLKAVGLGVAMENAEPAIKEIADFITGSNEEDGVAYAIETLVLA